MSLSCAHGATAPGKFGDSRVALKLTDHYARVRKCDPFGADIPLLTAVVRRSACRRRMAADVRRSVPMCAAAVKASTERDNKKEAGIGGAGT
jgi:hypothetical protein